MGRRKISTTVYITAAQDTKLKMLSERTGRPVAEFIRTGIDLVLEEHSDQIPVQLDLLQPPDGGQTS
jgi:predicted DNA-binding protein